jgi:hypothetical protein
VAQLRAGTARVTITPPVGLELSGWSFGPSRGIHDDLYAKVLAIDDGRKPVIFITADLIGLGTEYAEAFRKETAEKLNTAKDRIFISCSHTHSGPGGMKLRRWGKVDEAYLFSTLQKITDAVEAALNSMQPCRFGSGIGTVRGICINRREDGNRTIDESLPVIRIDRTDGNPLAVLFNYSCHPVAAHNDRNLISADYPGFARRELENKLEGASAFFTLGACGDVNPTEFHRLERAEEYGLRIGREAAAVCRSAEAITAVSVITQSIRVKLPVQDLPSEQELEKEIETREKEAEDLRRRGIDHKVEDTLIKKEWAEDALETRRTGNALKYLEMEMGLLCFGDTAVVSLPGELFTEIGLNIKSKSPFRITIISELTNGSLCYIPTTAAFERGGYETDFSAKVYGLYMLKANAQEIVETAAGKLLNAAAEQNNNIQGE